MARSARQSKILELIAKHEIETQEELQDILHDSGFSITQATVSRDIKELGLIKIMSDSKKYKYAVEKNAESSVSVKMANMFRESVISIDTAGNLIVVKTLSGGANSAGMLIDKLGFNGVLGCIAGDDAVLIVARNDRVVAEVVDKLNEIINL